MDATLFFLFFGTYTLGFVAGCILCRISKRDPKLSQVETAAQAREEALTGNAAYDDLPHCYVHCDYNPDEVKMFYEVPEVLADRIQSSDTPLTFTECLAQLIDTEETE